MKGKEVLEDYNYDYYQEYRKLYMASLMLSEKMNELLKTKNDLITKLRKF